MLGLDYTDRIDPAVLKAAGVAYVFRYVMPQTPYWTKALRNAEAAELLHAGIGIVSNWETSADRMKGGAAAGTQDALQLLADWRALGAPSGLVGWFSADWDVQPAEVPAVLAYLGAAAAVLGGKKYVGLYGGYRACKAAADAGYGIWQTEAWSYGQWDPRCAARQTGGQLILGGVETDRNTILNPAALGAWGGPASTSTTGVPDMTPDEHAALYNLGNGLFTGGPACGTPVPAGKPGSQIGIGNSIFSHLEYMTSMLEGLTGRPAPVIDPVALAAAIAPLLNAQATPEAIAAAVIAHLDVQVVAK